jgi:hypothetical protein
MALAHRVDLRQANRIRMAGRRPVRVIRSWLFLVGGRGLGTSTRSADTRVTTAPTVLQAIRISSVTAGLRALHRQPDDLIVERAGVPGIVSSHGTAATTTPCSEQRTRGASASSTACTAPSV